MTNPPSLGLILWRSSARFKALSRRNCAKMRAVLENRPRCGAKRRRSDEPCQKPAMKNGKCHLHGGRTPKGRNWHVAQWPDASDPRAGEKLVAKIADRQRAAAKRAKRLAKRSPEELAAHKAWQAAHRPGSPEKRAADRERRRQNRDAAKLLADPAAPRPPTGEAAAIADALAELRAQRDRLAAEPINFTSVFD